MVAACVDHGRVSLDALAALGDRIIVRDPRGRSRRPSLVPERDGLLRIEGPFAVIGRFSIAAADGRTFVETTRDENPIHVADSVVPGAMTAARFLLLPEILVPGLAVRSVRVRFRALSRYGRPSVNRFLFRPRAEGGMDVGFTCYQEGVTVADGSLTASPGERVESPRIGPDEPGGPILAAFFRSLAADPRRCAHLLGTGWPRALLASLPSGEMVRRGGAGGILNVLDLEFPAVPVDPIAGEAPPVVEVEASRPRREFRRILARVGNGIVTYCQGYATVLAAVVLGSPASHGARAS